MSGLILRDQLYVGSGSPDAAAKFQVDSTVLGVLFPRMTTTQRDAISNPPAGLTIYNTTTGQIETYDGSVWVGGAWIGDHGVQVYNSANQSIADNSITALTFDSERKDTDSYHDTVTNSSRLTVPSGQGGTYIITGHVLWDANATGVREIDIRLNGTTFIARERDAANTNHTQSVSAVYDLSATDYVELMVYQTSTASLDVVLFGNASPEFRMQRIA